MTGPSGSAESTEMEDEDIQLDTSHPPTPPMQGEEGASPPPPPGASASTADEDGDEVMTDAVAIGVRGAAGIGQLVRFAKEVSEAALMALGERYVDVSKVHAKAVVDQAKEIRAAAAEQAKAEVDEAKEIRAAAAEQAKVKAEADEAKEIRAAQEAKEIRAAQEAKEVRAHELKIVENERAHEINKQRQFVDMMKDAPAHIQIALWSQQYPNAPPLVVPAAQPIVPDAPVVPAAQPVAPAAPVSPPDAGSNIDEVMDDDDDDDKEDDEEDYSDGDGDYTYNGSDGNDSSGDEQTLRQKRALRPRRPRRGCAKVTARDLCEEDGLDPRAHAFDMPADVHNAMRLGGLLARAFIDRYGRRPDKTRYRSGHQVCAFSRKEAEQLVRCDAVRRFITGAQAAAEREQ